MADDISPYKTSRGTKILLAGCVVGVAAVFELMVGPLLRDKVPLPTSYKRIERGGELREGVPVELTGNVSLYVTDLDDVGQRGYVEFIIDTPFGDYHCRPGTIESDGVFFSGNRRSRQPEPERVQELVDIISAEPDKTLEGVVFRGVMSNGRFQVYGFRTSGGYECSIVDSN